MRGKDLSVQTLSTPHCARFSPLSNAQRRRRRKPHPASLSRTYPRNPQSRGHGKFRTNSEQSSHQHLPIYKPVLPNCPPGPRSGGKHAAEIGRRCPSARRQNRDTASKRANSASGNRAQARTAPPDSVAYGAGRSPIPKLCRFGSGCRFRADAPFGSGAGRNEGPAHHRTVRSTHSDRRERCT
jgi:hypothetical protein